MKKYCVNVTVFNPLNKVVYLDTMLVNSDLDDCLKLLHELRQDYETFAKGILILDSIVSHNQLFIKSKDNTQNTILYQIGEDFITQIIQYRNNKLKK